MRKKLSSWSTWKKNLNEMKFLKIYDPDPMTSLYTKAKLMKQELERTYRSKLWRKPDANKFLTANSFFLTTSVFSSLRTCDHSAWINNRWVRKQICPSVQKMLIRVSNKTAIYSPRMVQTRSRTQSQSWFTSEITNKIIKEMNCIVTNTISHIPRKKISN